MVLAVLVMIGVSGCTSTTVAPTTTPPVAAPTTAAPTSATLTADGTFEQPIVCRAVVDYETTQAAISAGRLATVRKVAALAASDAAAALASNRAHTWAADVQPLVPPYLAAADQQMQYFRAVAKARSIAEATALQWPDATTVSSAVYTAIGITGELTCPRP